MSQEVAEPKSKAIKKQALGRQVRLWVRARFSGFRRSKVQQNVNQPILQLEGVNDRQAAQYYFGKRVVYIYKTKSGEKDKRFRVHIKLCRPYGDASAEAMVTMEQLSLVLLLTCHLEQLALLLESCCSRNEADLSYLNDSHCIPFGYRHHDLELVRVNLLRHSRQTVKKSLI